ncbi:MAG TPA: hypothetical protein VFZ88_12505 [Sphingomicrobium sp.]
MSPLGHATEFFAIAKGELTRVIETAGALAVAAAELLGPSNEALLPIPCLGTLDTTIALVDAKLACRSVLDPLRPPLFAITLEVGEATLTATAALDALRLSISATTFDALELALTASAFHPLRLTVTAATLHAYCLALTATAPLDALRLMVAAALTLGLVASTTAATLGLGLSALSSALVGLR